MTLTVDRELAWLFGGVLAVLVAATIVGQALRATTRSEGGRATVANLNARIWSWWVMSAVFAGALLTGRLGAVILFALVSFFALREFITLTTSRPADHRALFYSFFLGIPLQYYLVAIQWYGLFSVLIPVYAFLYIPTRSALSGDTDRFLARVAEIHWGLMVCVFCVSHAPALLMLEIPGYAGQNAKLLLFLLVVVQMSDVLQYVWGKLCGRHPIAPTVSPNKTVEGFVGGIASATLLGTALWWATPFRPWEAAAMSLVITLMGFAGGLTMSAIKRDRGVKDFGAVIAGHGGILDRIDSLCFAGPIFFHLTRYFFTV
jgi:phosphatidate cytidylyltransferase